MRVTEGNVERVKRLFEAWLAGDLDRAEELFDPQIEWNEPPETIGRHAVVGPDAARAALANWSDQFDSIRAETTELREEGDRVLHALDQFARIQGSSVEIAGSLYMVWWFRDGRAVRMEMYNHREEAEAAFDRQPDS